MIKKIKELLQNLVKKSPKMGTRFAWVTSILVAIISVLVAISVLSFFSDAVVDITNLNRQNDIEISSKVFDEIKDGLESGHMDKTQKEISTLIKNDVVGYVTIVNKKDKKMIYSEFGKEKYHAADNTRYQDYTPQFLYDNKLITVGFYEKNQLLTNYYKKFINQLIYQTIFCILFGLIMAYILSQIIIRPLTTLKVATEKYKHGDFSEHIPKSNYEEIDNLIDTYNSMGESLNELYSSLEMKVEERTVALEKAYEELKNTQSILVHSEKMRSLGELVAGITHELNNPINFIYGNLIHLQNYSNDLISVIDKITEILKSEPENIQAKFDNIKNEADYEFIKDDLPALIKSCQDGAERSKNIVTDLKGFSRMDAQTITTVDVAAEIDSVLNILNNKIKHNIVVHKNYQENLPLVDVYNSQLGHVFMNILDNAAYAIKDSGNIYISITYDEKYVTIAFKDDGCGIKKEDQDKIFEPFYTTKAVGEGTGLGMSITYKIIKNHNGTIDVDSEEGVGTTFTIKLPIDINV